MKRLAILATAAWLLAGGAAAQQSEPPLGEGDSLVDFAYTACTQAPESDVCHEAARLLREQIIDALLQLGQGSRAEGHDVVALYLDHPDTAVRVAALAALGRLRPDATDTPALARLLNDPVPAVRQAALAALSDSSDPATIPLVDRAADDQGSSMLPDPPPDAGWLGASVPASAEPLRFASDRKAGVFAFVTDENPQQVLDYYTGLTGRPAMTLGELKAGLVPEWARKPGMGFYQELGERLENLASLPQDEMMLAQYRMALLMGMVQQGVEPDEIKRWRDAKLWGDVRAIVLAVDPLLEMPSQLLMVYRDEQLQRTGFAVQWLPAYAMPAPPTPLATTTETAAPKPLDYNPAEAEAAIWRAVAWRDTVETYNAYLNALPNGAHAAGARVALQRLKDEAAQQGQQQQEQQQGQQQNDQQQQSGEQQTGQTEDSTTPPLPSERKTVTTPAGVTLAADSPLRQLQPIAVTFSGLDKARSPWLSIIAKGAPDTQWIDWNYTHADQGTVTLPGQRPGDYEVRAYLENPREVVARLEVTYVSTASGPPAVALAGEAKAGQPIKVSFANLPGDKNDWISIAAVGKSDSEYNDWKYTYGKTDGEVTLNGQPAGEYELRAITDRPKREVVVRVTISVLP